MTPMSSRSVSVVTVAGYCYWLLAFLVTARFSDPKILGTEKFKTLHMSHHMTCMLSQSVDDDDNDDDGFDGDDD